MNYNVEQLKLPMDISVKIDKKDPVWSFMEIIREVNLGKYLHHHRGCQGYDGRMMLKAVLFAYMNGIYSLREMEDRCRNDIRFMYICDGETPSFMAFQRFISRSLKEELSDIFTEITSIICEKAKVNDRILYIDGTMIEANANKFTFVWKATAEKSLAKSRTRAIEAAVKAEEVTGIKYPEKEYDDREMKRYVLKVFQWCIDNNIEFVSGKGHRKSEGQRAYEELKKNIEKSEECEEKIAICGEDRNSYSKTDHDATFMHMKYDYYNNTGVFKPGYNIQLGESDGFIRNIRIGSERTDTKTFIPFMESYRERYGKMPGIVVADAGYGSYDNYMYTLSSGIGNYIKYPNYRLEKTAKFRKQTYRSENLLHEENGKYYCPNNREFIYRYDSFSEKGKYLQIIQNYECESCDGCPFRQECTKSKGNRKVRINVIMDQLRAAAKENLDSEAGIQLRQQRSIQAEGAFGIIKNDWNYIRVHRRGKKKVENEIYLISTGFNLKKYYQRMMDKMAS